MNNKASQTFKRAGITFLSLCLLLTLAACLAKPDDPATPSAPPSTHSQTPTLPDLAISGYGVSPQGCGAWNGVQVSVGVENIGAGDAGAFEVVVQRERSSFAGLPAGARVVAGARHDGPPGGVTGIADATHLIVESDETNNRVGVTFTPPPTCTPTPSPTPTITATPAS